MDQTPTFCNRLHFPSFFFFVFFFPSRLQFSPSRLNSPHLITTRHPATHTHTQKRFKEMLRKKIHYQRYDDEQINTFFYHETVCSCRKSPDGCQANSQRKQWPHVRWTCQLVELPRSIFTKVQADLSLLCSFALFIAFLFYCWQVGQSYSRVSQNRM